MLDEFLLAFRNTLRNKRRTAITLLSIVAGYLAVATFGGFIAFSFEGLRESTIRTQLGHFQIYAKGFTDNHVAQPEQYLLPDPAGIAETLGRIAGVVTATQRLSFSGLGTVGQSTVNVRAVGVDPAGDQDFADFETIVAGRRLRSGDQDVGVIGDELRKGLGAKVGDWVTILTTTVGGMINAVEFEIIGIAQTGSTEYDSVFVKVPLDLAQRARGVAQAERVVILLEATDMLERAREAIEARLTANGVDYEIRTWSELAGFYERVVALYMGIFKVLAVIIGIVVMFAVANTMAMSVFERTQEIGALRAIGARRLNILAMLLEEGLIIGVIGGLLGLLATIVVAGAIRAAGGIPISPPPGMSRGYQAQILLVPESLALAWGAVILIAIISTIPPAISASRLRIVDALQRS